MTEALIRLWVKNSSEVRRPEVRAAYGRLAGGVGILCNLLLCTGKFLAGALSGSIAIAADAVNNLSDAASSVVSLLGFRLSERPADRQHPYGHARYEYISGLVVAVMVLVIGFELAKESALKILHPQPTEFTGLAMGVLVVSIAAKLWLAAFNRTIGQRIDSGSLLATAKDSRNDVLATSAVLAAALVSRLFSLNLDGWMGLGVACFILYSGVRLIQETSDPLLGLAPDPELVAHVQQKIMSYPGVLGTHDLMVHDYGPGQQFASAHVEMAAESDAIQSHDVIDRIERSFWEEDGLHVVLHFDPIVTQNQQVQDLRCWLEQTVQTIAPELSIHDLRIVRGPTHTNLIFDCVVPPDFAMKDAQLKKEIGELVRQRDPSWYCMITVETGFAALPHG